MACPGQRSDCWLSRSRPAVTKWGVPSTWAKPKWPWGIIVPPDETLVSRHTYNLEDLPANGAAAAGVDMNPLCSCTLLVLRRNRQALLTFIYPCAVSSRPATNVMSSKHNSTVVCFPINVEFKTS